MISGGEGSSATRHKFFKCEMIDSRENTLKFELETRAWIKTEAGVKVFLSYFNKTTDCTYNVQSDNSDRSRHGILRERATVPRGRFVPDCGRSGA